MFVNVRFETVEIATRVIRLDGFATGRLEENGREALVDVISTRGTEPNESYTWTENRSARAISLAVASILAMTTLSLSAYAAPSSLKVGTSCLQ